MCLYTNILYICKTVLFTVYLDLFDLKLDFEMPGYVMSTRCQDMVEAKKYLQSEGREFESWHRILDHFSHLFVVNLCCCLKTTKNKCKRGWAWPIKKQIYS